MVESVTLRRRDFVASLSRASIDVATAKADSRLAGVDVEAADLNGDGKIRGERECGRLFEEIDRLDHNGSSSSVQVVARDGTATAVAAPIAAVGDLGRAAGLQRTARSAEPGNDDILFIGMRTETRTESDALARRGRGQFSVTAVGSDSSTVTVGGTRYDLSTNAGMRSFADSLGVSQAQADGVYAALQSNPVNGRDELAQLAIALARGENGGSMPSRIVISGHHAGGTFFGDNGTLSDRAVMDLARALPNGAAKVEDLHLAGCYSHGRSTLDGWREAFPNLQSVWGYGHTAPSANGGAKTHEAQWDSATRGRVGILDRTAARGTRHDDEVIVWSRQGGFQSSAAARPIADLRRDVAGGESAYNSALAGTTSISDPHSGPVREYYSALNDLAEHPDLPATDRPAIEDRRARAIRLLYFSDVARGWSGENSALLGRAYSQAGMTQPDFATMNRRQALAAINTFLDRTQASRDPDVLAAREQMIALRDLDPAKIRVDWIR